MQQADMRTSQRSTSSGLAPAPGSTDSAWRTIGTVVRSARTVTTGGSGSRRRARRRSAGRWPGHPRPRRTTPVPCQRSRRRRRASCSPRWGGGCSHPHRPPGRAPAGRRKAFQNRPSRGDSASSWTSTGCHGVQAASRSAAASMLPDAVSTTQSLASDDTDGGSAVCCGK